MSGDPSILKGSSGADGLVKKYSFSFWAEVYYHLSKLNGFAVSVHLALSPCPSSGISAEHLLMAAGCWRRKIPS
jgi:hypothetical protein